MMTRFYLKFTAILFMLILLSGVIYSYFAERSDHSPQKRQNHLFVQTKKYPVIRGFHFSGYHEGQKAISIKAAKFSVEKKKIGIFKLSPIRAARFRGAEVDLYVNNEKFSENSQGNKPVTFKGLFSQETMPVSSLNGVTSVVFEPIKINFHLDNKPITQIRANSAALDQRRRRVILMGEILATAEFNQLSTERLMIYPEKGTIEVNNKFVLKTQDKRIIGEKLTTDFLLKRLDMK